MPASLNALRSLCLALRTPGIALYPLPPGVHLTGTAAAYHMGAALGYERPAELKRIKREDVRAARPTGPAGWSRGVASVGRAYTRHWKPPALAILSIRCLVSVGRSVLRVVCDMGRTLRLAEHMRRKWAPASLVDKAAVAAGSNLMRVRAAIAQAARRHVAAAIAGYTRITWNGRQPMPAN